jgi:predicted PurR-regulated permease PerM
MNNSDQVKKGMVIVIILAIFVLAFLVLRPIIIPILFGLLFAYIFGPVYKKIYKLIKRKNISAFLIIVGFIIIVGVPIIYLVPSLVNQTFATYMKFQNLNVAEILGNLMESDITSSLAKNIDNIVGQMFSSFLNQFTNVLVNLPSLLLQFAVFLFTFFFAVRDSEELRKTISSLSPFSKNMEGKIMNEFRGITNAIVFGQMLIGVIQGLALGAGLFFLGVPNVLTLTFIAAIVSIIPLVGAWAVWLPVSIFLFIEGQVWQGVFLLLYGALFVSTIDNFLRPYILSKQSRLPIVLSIIGTVGGLYFFGIAGILLGPLILAYVLIIIEFYQEGKLKELLER